MTGATGICYPTKRFDQEARLTEHALRHLRVINGKPGPGGSGGRHQLVRFDYNTHGSFGSGDKICYHGVLICSGTPNTRPLPMRHRRNRRKEPVLEACYAGKPWGKGWRRHGALLYPDQL